MLFPDIQCRCRRKFVANSFAENSTESPALLNHGSLLSIGCMSFLFIILDLDARQTKIVKSIPAYAQAKSFHENDTMENDLIRAKWKNRDKSLANKKDLLSMCSTKLNFKMKNDNKRPLID